MDVSDGILEYDAKRAGSFLNGKPAGALSTSRRRRVYLLGLNLGQDHMRKLLLPTTHRATQPSELHVVKRRTLTVRELWR